MNRYFSSIFLTAIFFATFQCQAQRRILFSGRDGFWEKPHQHGAERLLLTNKTNLFVKVSLVRPMMEYLSDLAPGLSNDSLAKIGNYQFSFFVDDRLIYRTELMPGAPRPAQLQKDTVWTKPLIDNQHEGAWWSQSAWNRFMYHGGDSALTDGRHQLRIVLRPYVKAPDLKIGEPVAEGILPLLVKRYSQIDLSTIKLSPVQPYVGLQVSGAPYDIAKIKKLKAYIQGDAFKHITSVVVLRNGKILIEEYFNGATRDSLHDVRSVGKTFASAVAGIAINDGFLKSENQQLKDFYDFSKYGNFSAAKTNTTIRELLTMSSRFNGDDDDMNTPGNEEHMYPTSNWVKFALDLPLDTVKYKGQWHYFTAGVMLLGSLLDSIVPQGLEKYADRKLFRPMQIVRYQWPYTPQHVPNTAGGIQMNALDFAKFGQLYANGGRWEGKQLLPQSWVARSLSRQLPITGREDEYYGYLFWNKIYRSGGKAYEAYYCSGNGGNKIYVLKDSGLVVVITATAYGTAYAHTQADRILQEFILPAVVP